VLKTASSQAVISILVVLIFGSVLGIFLTQPITIDEHMHDAMMLMLGALGSNFTCVVSYYMGSSAGSKHANETLSQLASGTGPGTTTTTTATLKETSDKVAVLTPKENGQ
jgi:archaellum component FlaG (FlaF/FlaG flagellin family)